MTSYADADRTSLTFRLGDSGVVVEGPRDLLDVLRFAYADFIGVEGPAHFDRYSVERRADRVVLHHESQKTLLLNEESDVELSSWLDWCVSSHLLGDDPGLAMVLHAAAVALPGDGTRTVLVVGPSGAGKSTLCAALVADGCTLLSDEFVPIDPITLRPIAYPRAIGLKERPRSKVGIDAVTVDPDATGYWLRPTRRLVPGARGGPVESIFFCAFEAEAGSVRRSPIGPARSLVRLLEHAPMLSDFPKPTFDTLSALASAAPSEDLVYRDAALAARSIRSARVE